MQVIDIPVYKRLRLVQIMY